MISIFIAVFFLISVRSFASRLCSGLRMTRFTPQFQVFHPVHKVHPSEQNREDSVVDTILESAFLNMKLEKPLHRLNMHIILNFLLLQRAPVLLENQRFPLGISVMAVHKLSDD